MSSLTYLFKLILLSILNKLLDDSSFDNLFELDWPGVNINDQFGLYINLPIFDLSLNGVSPYIPIIGKNLK